METRHLIDGIVRQTTVLIAQLSTVAGIRAPLSGLADQVFLSLARELEAQGVRRKVASDMFGLALRSYQLKLTRLTSAESTREQTLWELVLEQLRATGGCSRRAMVQSFRTDDPAAVAAVLNDLVDSGLASRAGRGELAFYQLVSSDAAAALAEQENLDAVTHLVWLAVYDRQRVAREVLIKELPFDAALSTRALDALIASGKIERERDGDEALLICRRLDIPVGAEQGWETAVFDHFRAVANAIAAKLQRSGPRSSHGDVVGGSTISFSLRAGHPFEAEVYGLLTRVRAELHEVLGRVSAYNEAHAIDPAERIEVTFYFGQNVIAAAAEGSESV